MILAAALAVHFITWQHEAPGQIGVAVGQGRETRLLVMVPRSGCADGMRVYSGKYGETDAALELIEHSKVCAASAKASFVAQMKKAEKQVEKER